MTDSALQPTASNRLTPMQFVLGFGVVSMLADFVYQGARAIVGPYLATLGASAAMVGAVTGIGEAVALVLRLATGRISDRTQRHWALSIAGYLTTVVAVPLLGITQSLWPAAALVIAERFGKAVRAPARDTMLAQASAKMGRGMAFAAHEALDQSGALLGPLLAGGMILLSGYRAAFQVMAVPGALAIIAVLWLRRTVPQPALYDQAHAREATQPGGAVPAPLPRRFWHYCAFTAASMAGFATFGVLSYHLQARHVLARPLIPVTYSLAMAAAALAALGSGRLYDRVGLRGLVIALPLTAVIPVLSFSTHATWVWIGAGIWGVVMGIHGSTLRAAVADMVPRARLGTAYGIFTAAYGLAWLLGSTVIGALYDSSIAATVYFTAATQILALTLFLPLARRPAAR
ncbi:MAG: MFS transporter [Proteobacteria bacterium]|nr:MFS transporter [Pseudomonadota bacterium]